MADTDPLARLIARHVTPELLERIAEQARRGRWLLVATTNLDARRPVIWNMGRIAMAGTPEALALFREVLLASASIPGAFPPVMIDVELGGEPHQEMHVDGGAMAQSFLFPPSFSTAAFESDIVPDRERHVYVIRNARLDPQWASVDRRTISIMGRAVSSLIQSQGFGDLYRIYAVAQRHGMAFNLAFIPPDFDVIQQESFDTVYMRALFERGYRMALEGYPWSSLPPGLEQHEGVAPARAPGVTPP